MIELRGPRVTMRAFRPEEIDPALRKIAESSAMVEGDPSKETDRRSRLERSGTRAAWEVLLAIEVDDHLVGDAQARCSDQAMPPGVWEIGIELYEPEDRGRGIGREAVALLTSHLFSEQGAHRIQATTDLDNPGMRRVLEALGFANEGTLRSFMPAAEGPPRDYAIYAMTKDYWTREGARWIPTS